MKRETFNSKLGVLAAAAGSAIGLGNIWRFPYITGQNGGAAFILVYIICIALIGVVMMMSELALGRKTNSNPIGAFKKLNPKGKWHYTGILAVLTSFIILSFYLMIAGWVFSYFISSLTGQLLHIAPENLSAHFETISSSTFNVLFWNFIVIVVTSYIVISGVQKGIEKYSKILMPILLFTLIALMFRSVTLEGAKDGLDFLFKPDFSKLTTQAILEALGHAFYSLSLGMGIIITYGSYIDKGEELKSLSFQVILTDTVIAIMAGIVIFPAVFAYGFEPAAGPALIFITLPAVFQSMPFGGIFETLFFLLVGIAAITSTISLLEVSVSALTEEFDLGRKKAILIISFALFLLSMPSSLSFSSWSGVKIFGLSIFELLDFIASYIFLPIGGILTCIFISWIWGTKNAFNEICGETVNASKSYSIYNFLIKYIAPLAIFIILLYSTGIIKF